MDIFVAAIRKAFPKVICEHSGPPFKRPDFTGDDTLYDKGFYWENFDYDRFYFPTYDSAALDFATEIGMHENEAISIVHGGDITHV
jgi:hypothetical protein